MRNIIIAFLLMCGTAQAQFMPPLPAPFIPNPVMRRFLPALAQRNRWQKKPIDLKEIHIAYDPHSPHDERWMRQLKIDLVTPWSETVRKLKRYHDASPEGKKKWENFGEKMDARVKLIKDQVTIHTHKSTKLAYSLDSKYGPWVELPRGKHPYPTFWISFVEYNYQDYSWKEHEDYYEYAIQDKREEIWQRYFETWVVEWAKKKSFTIRPEDIKATDFTVTFYGLPNYYGYGTFYSNCDFCMQGCNEWCLEDEGFNPPAIADKPKPKKLIYPDHLLYGKDDF